MKIEYRPIADIRPYESNPRRNDRAVAKVAESIRQFGFRQPIVVDADGVIIVGHTRYRAALELGLESVPVHVVTDLSPEQMKAYRIADNKTGSLATWDYEKLRLEIGELRECEYDLGVLGFSEDELSRVLTLESLPGEVEETRNYAVIVDCETEEEQRRVYEYLEAGGYRCRLTVF